MRILQSESHDNKRNANRISLITSLDPDAPSRQNKKLYPEDAVPTFANCIYFLFFTQCHE